MPFVLEAASLDQGSSIARMEDELRKPQLEPAGSTLSRSRSIKAQATAATLAETDSGSQTQFRSDDTFTAFDGLEMEQPSCDFNDRDDQNYHKDQFHPDNFHIEHREENYVDEKYQRNEYQTYYGNDFQYQYDDADEEHVRQKPVFEQDLNNSKNYEEAGFMNPNDDMFQDQNGRRTIHNDEEDWAGSSVGSDTCGGNTLNTFRTEGSRTLNTNLEGLEYSEDNEEETHYDDEFSQQYDSYGRQSMGGKSSAITPTARNARAAYDAARRHNQVSSPIRSVASDGSSSWEGDERDHSLVDHSDASHDGSDYSDDDDYSSDEEENDSRIPSLHDVIQGIKHIATTIHDISSDEEDESDDETEYGGNLIPEASIRGGRRSSMGSKKFKGRRSSRRLSSAASTADESIFSRFTAMGENLIESMDTKTKRRRSKGGGKTPRRRKSAAAKTPAKKILQSVAGVFNCGVGSNY